MRITTFLFAMALLLADAPCRCALNPGSSSTLLDWVEVSGDVILLSDLLPPDAPLELRTRTSMAVLAQSPLPGSARVLARDAILRQLHRLHFSADGIEMPSEVTVVRRMLPIDGRALQSAIARYLALHGWESSEMPAMGELVVTAKLSRAGPVSLQVDGADWDPARQALKFHMHCLDRGQCGGFLVWVTPPAALAGQWQERMHRGQTSIQPACSLTAPESGAPELAALTLPGDRAILLLEQNGMRLSIPVVCLERGTRKQQIRVRAVKNGRIFRAEVVGADRLLARF